MRKQSSSEISGPGKADIDRPIGSWSKLWMVINGGEVGGGSGDDSR